MKKLIVCFGVVMNLPSMQNTSQPRHIYTLKRNGNALFIHKKDGTVEQIMSGTIPNIPNFIKRR